MLTCGRSCRVLDLVSAPWLLREIQADSNVQTNHLTGAEFVRVVSWIAVSGCLWVASSILDDHGHRPVSRDQHLELFVAGPIAPGSVLADYLDEVPQTQAAIAGFFC